VCIKKTSLCVHTLTVSVAPSEKCNAIAHLTLTVPTYLTNRCSTSNARPILLWTIYACNGGRIPLMSSVTRPQKAVITFTVRRRNEPFHGN